MIGHCDGCGEMLPLVQTKYFGLLCEPEADGVREDEEQMDELLAHMAQIGTEYHEPHIG